MGTLRCGGCCSGLGVGLGVYNMKSSLRHVYILRDEKVGVPVKIVVGALSITTNNIVKTLFKRGLPIGFGTRLAGVFKIYTVKVNIDSVKLVGGVPTIVFTMVVKATVNLTIGLNKVVGDTTAYVRGPIKGLFPGGGGSVSERRCVSVLIAVVMLFYTDKAKVCNSLSSKVDKSRAVLVSGSVLSFFATVVFKKALNVIVMTITVPRYIVFLVVFTTTGLVFPLAAPSVVTSFGTYKNFLLLTANFQVTGVRSFPITSVVPTVILIVPID